MRATTVDAIGPQNEDELLTTGEAAQILSSSRQHIVNLCRRGDLPFVTTGRHRRVRRGDVEVLQTRTNHLTRDQARSLWLGYAVAGKLVTDPTGVLEKARNNLAHLRDVHARGAANRWLLEWQVLLDGPIAGVLEVLTSRSPRARELRKNSPFAGVLSEQERKQILSNLGGARGTRG